MNQYSMKPLLGLALIVGSVLVFTTFSLSNSGSSGSGSKLEQKRTTEGEKASIRISSQQKIENPKERSEMSHSSIDWSSVDFSQPALPSLDEQAQHVTVNSKKIQISGVETFYLDAQPPPNVTPSGVDVLLLHGAAFSSKTWLDLNTINLLAAMGHHVIAVDLPGFGHSKSSQISASKELYLEEFIKATAPTKNPVIVSPSMSGGFSVPFVIAHPEMVLGYIPVAPVDTTPFATKGRSFTVPTLIIHGEKDLDLGTRSAVNLENIPTSTKIIIPKGNHPAYLDDPKLFHTLLYNFIDKITS